MGQPPSKTAFSFIIRKSGGVVVFDYYDVSGSNTIVGNGPTNTYVRFFWNDNSNPYVTAYVSPFEMVNPTRSLEFSKIKSNYYPKINRVNNEYVEVGLYTSSPGVSYISWLSMLGLVQSDFELKCTCNVSTGELGPLKVTNDFRYLTMLSPNNISNNGIYYNQEGSTVYFNNDAIDVNVTVDEFTNLSNALGDYMLTVDIDEDGNITMVNTYMTNAIGYERIDDENLLIKLDIPMDSVKGVGMTNVNSNSMFIINSGVILEKTNEGILCNNINNGMNFTMLISLTERT